jgi:hypothetical protein
MKELDKLAPENDNFASRGSAGAWYPGKNIRPVKNTGTSKPFNVPQYDHYSLMVTIPTPELTP